MDSQRMKDDEKLRLTRFYFFGGFALLPFLWLINSIWFFKEAFYNPRDYPEKNQIKNYVLLSIFFALISFTVIIGWNLYFQLNRTWLPWADSLSFITPIGVV